MVRAGQETFIMNVYRNIDRSKVQFDFLLSDSTPGDYDQEIKKLGGNLYYISLDQSNNKLRHLKNYTILKKTLKKLSAKEDIFYIHTHHAFDAYLSARAALKENYKKVFVHSHSDSAEYHIKLHKLFKSKLTKLPVIKIAASEACGKWLFSNNDFIIIKSGIDTQKFVFNPEIRKKIRNDLKINDNSIVLGHVGRFASVKNHHKLIKIFYEYSKINPNAKLILVGSGDLERKIKREVINLSLDKKTFFVGSRSNVQDYYQAMDVFVFPSFFEGLGMSIIEAEISGLPCVISSEIPLDVNLSSHVYRCKVSAPELQWVIAIKNATKKINNRASYKNARERAIAAKLDISTATEELQKLFLND